MGGGKGAGSAAASSTSYGSGTVKIDTAAQYKLGPGEIGGKGGAKKATEFTE